MLIRLCVLLEESQLAFGVLHDHGRVPHPLWRPRPHQAQTDIAAERVRCEVAHPLLDGAETRNASIDGGALAQSGEDRALAKRGGPAAFRHEWQQRGDDVEHPRGDVTLFELVDAAGDTGERE